MTSHATADQGQSISDHRPLDEAAETDPLLEDQARHVNSHPATTTASGEEAETENPNRPKGLKFAVVFACILMGDFFVGYDTSCVTTLTPIITKEFGALDDLGWYGIAYLLASASTVLIFGQLYTVFPMKAIFLVSFGTFAAGCAMSAAAPSSVIFIIGRAVSGLGSAGVFSGGSIIIANTTPLATRPIYQGLFGGMECVALVLGPLVAGAIAHAIDWRAAFWIMVPFAAFIILSFSLLVQGLPQPEKADKEAKTWLAEIDFAGAALFMPATVCLVLSLQWAGITYAWQNPRILVLLILTLSLTLAFLYSQRRRGDTAMFPLHLLRNRNVSLAATSQFFISGTLFVFGFYLPVYFQAVRGASTLQSGLMYLPSAGSLALAIFFAGPLTSLIGYYTPIMLAGTILMSVGGGLLTTLDTQTPPANWITYQILLGLGAGLSFQQTYTALQTVLPEKNVATAIVTLSFVQELGAIVVLAISQNLFLFLLTAKLEFQVPGLDAKTVLEHGTVDLPSLVAPEYRDRVLDALSESVFAVFVLGVTCAILTVTAVGIEWRSVKEERKSDARERVN